MGAQTVLLFDLEAGVIKNKPTEEKVGMANPTSPLETG